MKLNTRQHCSCHNCQSSSTIPTNFPLVYLSAWPNLPLISHICHHSPHPAQYSSTRSTVTLPDCALSSCFPRLSSRFLPITPHVCLPACLPLLLWSPWNSERFASSSGNPPCLVSSQFAFDHPLVLSPLTTD